MSTFCTFTTLWLRRFQEIPPPHPFSQFYTREVICLGFVLVKDGTCRMLDLNWTRRFTKGRYSCRRATFRRTGRNNFSGWNNVMRGSACNCVGKGSFRGIYLVGSGGSRIYFGRKLSFVCGNCMLNGLGYIMIYKRLIFDVLR